MSLRHGSVPFTSVKDVRNLYKIVYNTSREWLHVASLAGSCALKGKGNDLDIILVPFWNGPTDPYPTRLPLDSVEHMINTIAEKVGGEMPEDYLAADGHEISAQVDYYSGVIYRTIWLPDKKVIDLKCYPAEYVRSDIRKALSHPSVRREDVHNKLFPFPLREYTPKQLARQAEDERLSQQIIKESELACQ